MINERTRKELRAKFEHRSAAGVSPGVVGCMTGSPSPSLTQQQQRAQIQNQQLQQQPGMPPSQQGLMGGPPSRQQMHHPHVNTSVSTPPAPGQNTTPNYQSMDQMGSLQQPQHHSLDHSMMPTFSPSGKFFLQYSLMTD